jgi:large subunit ribosomal protein L27
MAHKKAAGSVKNNRDSKSKRLGVKVFGSEKVVKGEILVRQRGTKFHPGVNVKRAADDSLISLADGVLEFVKKKVIAFNGNLTRRTFLNIVPKVEVEKKPAAKKVVAKAAKPAVVKKKTVKEKAI